MEHSVNNLIENVKISEPMQYKNLSVFPVSYLPESKYDYISLDNAISKNYVKIGEIDESGNVNTLIVKNTSYFNVLLLDGEELIGAKQNRVLNTTILIEKQSNTVIPVSCVERGRWSYQSKEFRTSDRIMSSNIKAKKMEDVHYNLNINPENPLFSSNQRRVWEEVDELLLKRKYASGTSSMSDAFDSSKDIIEKYIEHFKFDKTKNGIVVVINGRIVGFEMISKSEVFEEYFPKLLRGFVIDAIDDISEKFEEITNENVIEFLRKLKKCRQSSYKSVGLGDSFRYESEETIAAVLSQNDVVIHISQLLRKKSEGDSAYQGRRQNTIRRKIKE